MLKAQSSVDAFTFGVLASVCTAANILALAGGGYASRWVGNRAMMLFILPVCFVALLACLFAFSATSFGLTFLLFNLCLGTLDLFMNSEASAVEADLRKPVFASFHAVVLYAIGATGLAAGFISFGFGTAWACLLALPIVLSALLAVYWFIPKRNKPESKTPKPAKLPRKALALVGTIIGLDVACELACIQWAGQLLAEMQPSLGQYSGLGVAFYGICNGTVRLFGDSLRSRFSDTILVTVSLCISVLGFALLATNPGFALSVIAFAVTGCGLGLIFPCLFSVAAGLAPHSRGEALGFASAVSGPPRIVLPVVLGALAQTYGLSAIYVASLIVCLCALSVTFWAAREINRVQQKNAAPG